METIEKENIQEMPLGTPFFRIKVERFLEANGLRLEALDAYYTLQNNNGDIVAGAGLQGDVIKCVAVAPEARSEGLMVPLISHIMGQCGKSNLKVFTKPENRSIFESLGFRVLAQAPLAVLMENGRGLEQYCASLRDLSCHSERSEESPVGVIIMNANPFTLGHAYLIRRALEQVETLFVIPVFEENLWFSSAQRKEMMEAGVSGVPGQVSRVVVADGSPYQISAATFPTYFLKDLSGASETQMRLDLDLFVRHIAPALGATVRFVGSEPLDPLTARYNELMAEVLPAAGLELEVIPRLEESPDSFISASAVREALSWGDYARASALTPASTHPYLLGYLAHRALLMELDTPLKPGLVCPDSPGAHKDMDYGTMLAGINALRPFWARMAQASSADELRQLGIDAENAMLAATGGVNTHRGAIFALGLAVNAIARRMEVVDSMELMQKSLCEIAQGILRNSLTDSKMHSTAIGARRMALSGYRDLFEDWLPFYRKALEEGTLPEAETKADASGRAPSTQALQKTLLHIMSTLDDTCVMKRVGKERAQEVKREAEEILRHYAPCHPEEPQATKDLLQDMCARYAAEGISPGGAADMLALTIFMDSIIKQ